MKSRLLILGLAWCAAGLASAPARGNAQAFSSSGECTTDNLLSLRNPHSQQGLHGNAKLVTDNAVGPEGAQWDAPIGIILDTPDASITYDLGAVKPVASFLVQADANDTYKIFGADVDRPEAYKLLVEVDNVVNIGHGLRTRTVTIEATPVRYLRIGEAVGDGYFSITEFQAYCRAPTPFPPKMTISEAPPAIVVQPSFWKFAWWENDASSRFEMGLAIFAMLLIVWGIWLKKKGRPDFKKKLRDRLMILVGVLSFCAYWNFFSFHFGNYVHMWDTFHYYVGSKYFKELSYDRLYECVAVADSEEPGLRRRVELRKIMNLRTNMMVGTQEVLANPGHCKDHFTPERWALFRHDVAYFRNHHDIKRWEEAQTDHGYNGSPVWNIVGTTLSNMAPVSDAQIAVLTRIDPFFILGICAMAWWAFGWRAMCVALAVFATNFPSRFYWTGGSFLRWDWLFYLVGGICLVKKNRPVLGGFFLGYTTLLRIFPMFVFSGPLLLILRQLWGSREGRQWYQPEPWDSWKGALARIDRRLLRIVFGAALSVAVLVPISLVTSNGIDGYLAFKFNTEKHKETPLTNYMGLRTVIVYKPSEAGRVMKDDRQEDPWGPWKRQKVQTWKDRRFFYVLLAGAWLWLLYQALRDADPWTACAMGAMSIAFGPVELTCYYYSFLFAVALLYEKRRDAGAILLGVTAATGFLDWAPTRYLPDTKPWADLKMPQWLDEQYMWMSIATVLGFVWILYRFAYPPENAVQAAVATAGADASEAVAAPAVPHVPRGNKRRGGGGGGGGRRRGGRRGRR